MESELLSVPPPTHVVYIPFVLIIGIVIGFIFGRKAGIRDGKDQTLGAGRRRESVRHLSVGHEGNTQQECPYR